MNDTNELIKEAAELLNQMDTITVVMLTNQMELIHKNKELEKKIAELEATG